MDNNPIKYDELGELPEVSEVIEEQSNFDGLGNAINSGVFGGQTAQAGIQTQDLQALLNGFSDALNQSAIAASTGMPVRTPSAQYKGFAAEEWIKQTMKADALSKGIPNYKIGIYTKGELPDGTVLSATDMHSDVVVYERRFFWQKTPNKVADAQVKIHKGPNAEKLYAKEMAKEQYAQQEFVGGAGQGVNDKFHAKIGNKEVVSDSITPEAAERLADDLKAQKAPEYENAQQKQQQLNRVNLGRAVAVGAVAGAVFSAVGEICYVIKNKDSLDEDQFIKSIQHILCGAIDGGVRGGAIMGSVQAIGAALGREIPTNSLGAVPIMAAANIAVDFAKDLYKCFVVKTIDTDDLLCNTVNNSFSSFAGFGGAWVGGQIAGQVISHGAGALITAKVAAATGASIGSAVGPIGTIVGAAVGGLVFGLGANAVIKVSNKDAEKAFQDCMKQIDEQIELEGCEKLYYFADSMANLSEHKLSFKDLLPCKNIISDLKEYNLHKKAIKQLEEQLNNTSFDELEKAKEEALRSLEKQHRSRLSQLQIAFQKQREMMIGEFRETMKVYISDSYTEYSRVYAVFSKDIESINDSLQQNIVLHNNMLDYSKNRNKVNAELNQLLSELREDNEDYEMVRPLVDEIIHYMEQDEFIVGKQFISFDDALCMVSGDK